MEFYPLEDGDYKLTYDDFILIISPSRYINATALCRLYNKDWHEWVITNAPLVKTLSRQYGEVIHKSEQMYVHPSLIPHILYWISPPLVWKLFMLVCYIIDRLNTCQV